ncbi:MAG: HAD-IIIA family hydrolase [Lentisphaerota bacterium]
MMLKEKALNIKAVILDIDGVLTDGSIGYSQNSDEIKFFNVKDGLAISLALQNGIKVGILSGRSSKANKIRAEELKLSFFYEGEKDKGRGFDKILSEQNLQPFECMYVGDDIIDIPPMKKAGISVAVGDAVEELDSFCTFRTKEFGGKGAVREAIVWLLKEKDLWKNILQKY